MIFVTLGTHGQPFPRALRVAATMARYGNVLVQHGETPADQSMEGVQWVRYLDWPAMRTQMASADVVVCHAGVGSTISALRVGKLPILVPRLAAYGEHVDDHQLQLASRFAEAGLALVENGQEPIRRLLDRARVGVPVGMALGDGRLPEAVARAVARSG